MEKQGDLRLASVIGAKALGNWGVFVYFVTVLCAVGLLFALAAVPRNSVNLFPDPSPEELVTFYVDPWLEQLRQHERVTNANRAAQDAVQRFHSEGVPKVTHLIAAEHRDASRMSKVLQSASNTIIRAISK